jgi:hypothetical protein
MFMNVKGLDRPGIAQSGRNLGAIGREFRSGPASQADDFNEKAAIVRPHGARLDAHAVDQFKRIRLQNHVADAFVAYGRMKDNILGRV